MRYKMMKRLNLPPEFKAKDLSLLKYRNPGKPCTVKVVKPE